MLLLCPFFSFSTNFSANSFNAAVHIMSDQPELWTCPQCGMQQDISQLGFFAELQCPQCGASAYVHTMLANYKVDSVLGIGGMSVVFKARDLVLGRPLAIKVLNDTYRDAPERIAGFANECSIMAKVRHDNVVSVYSAGWARGQFFIAMELLEGRNLELIVREQGSLPALESLEIVRQVAMGLQAAHTAGILHRDVKPGNVLIAADGQAKVLDFGLSQDEKTQVDSDGVIWATPYYVPPETLRSEEENVQSDIYALGMTLRNLLTGESTLPENPQTVPDMLVAKKTLMPLHQLKPELDIELCELLDTMTAFEPADRPADYGELLPLIESVQKILTDNADPEVIAHRRREKLYVAAGVAGTVALGLLGAYIVALLTPAARVQEAFNADVMQWPDPQSFSEAERLLTAGDNAGAAGVLGEITGDGSEPTVAAAGILMRTAQDVLDGKSSANGYKRFAEVAARSSQVAPAGQAVYEQMTAFVAALQQDVAKAAELAGAMENRLLKTSAQLLVADRYVCSGKPELAEQTISAVAAAMAGDESAAFRSRIEEYGKAVPRRSARMQLIGVKDMFRTGKYDEAIASIPALAEQKLSHAEKEELQVLSEAVVVMRAIHEAMKRNGRQVTPGMKPADLRTAAAGMGESENLPKEFYCIGLMLSDEIDAAFRENPYAGEPDSSAPFAVMMREWKTRLGK